jgi:HSP20 family protein
LQINIKEKKMLITRYNPLDEFRDIRRGFDMLNSMINNVEKSRGSEGTLVDFVPSVNTREGEYAYHVEVDLPGIKKEDVDISVEGNVLTISGERKVENEIKEDAYYKIESAYGKFSRSFTLPEKVDVEDIHAESAEGVLEIIVPKLKEVEVKPKKIEIK